MKMRIRALAGPLEGQTFPLGSRTILGRSGDVHVQILAKGVSRQHACIVERDDGALVLMDMSSTNGTFVGDEAISLHIVEPDTEFRIGETRFVVEAAEDEEPEDEDPMSVSSVQLRVVAGVAEDQTSIDAMADMKCRDPLHLRALAERWRYCPSCGETLLEE